MEFKCFDGSTIKMNLLQSHYPMKDMASCRSYAQYYFGQQLVSLFGSEVILEDFVIPRSGLSLDFFMPRHRIAFEIQGRQHDQFVPFMHGDRLGFRKQLERDNRKAEWCKANNIRLITIKDKDVPSVDILELLA